MSRAPGLSRDDAAELCGHVAALSLAGLPVPRIWQVLAEGRGPAGEVAGAVAGMLAVGGSSAQGLRLAADRCVGPGTEALSWLAVSIDVVERCGAPAALVLDQVAAGLLAQIAQADEQDVALAGPQATASVLSVLPAAGIGLGALMGVNSVAVLVGTPLGWVCACGGALLWIAGRAWTTRMVRSAGRADG